jgi:hypothetical protein
MNKKTKLYQRTENLIGSQIDKSTYEKLMKMKSNSVIKNDKKVIKKSV